MSDALEAFVQRLLHGCAHDAGMDVADEDGVEFRYCKLCGASEEEVNAATRPRPRPRRRERQR